MNHVVFHAQTDSAFIAITALESNLLFLKDGGIQQGIELRPLDDKYGQDWEIAWNGFLELETALKEIQIEDDVSIPVNNVEKIERISHI